MAASSEATAGFARYDVCAIDAHDCRVSGRRRGGAHTRTDSTGGSTDSAAVIYPCSVRPIPFTVPTFPAATVYPPPGRRADRPDLDGNRATTDYYAGVDNYRRGDVNGADYRGKIDRSIDRVEDVLRPARQKIGHLGDVTYHTIPYSFNNVADVRNLQQYYSIEHYQGREIHHCRRKVE